MNSKYYVHNTEVAWFLAAHRSLEKHFFLQNVKECRSTIQFASFSTEIGLLYIPQSTF